MLVGIALLPLLCCLARKKWQSRGFSKKKIVRDVRENQVKLYEGGFPYKKSRRYIKLLIKLFSIQTKGVLFQ